jgi:signal transduction histidine kinase
VTGRKGIGKLAALYLSSTYYLVSRTKTETSSWCLDMSHVTDNDIPSMSRQNNVAIESNEFWKKHTTGTLIKLINVDLRNIGEKTIEGIKARLADYYSFNDNNVDILVALRQTTNDQIVFGKVEKQIAFKNFYAFFNNTNTDFCKKLAKKIFLRTSIPEKKFKDSKDEVYYKECPVVLLKKDFETKGEKYFLQGNGKESEKSYKYEMCGWIGIHSTIEKEEAKINDDVFLKNKAYQPNRLRVYVRNKLAVENFMEYMQNTQAFGKYIEGEIHFDILDSNELPDIATANRQGYKADTDRIATLIQILKPIIGALIRERSDIGTNLRKSEKEYWQAKEDAERAEKEKAEATARVAEEARAVAERKWQEAEKSRQQAEEDLNVRKQQTYFLENALTNDDRTSLYNTHVIKCNAEDIDGNLKFLLKKHPELSNDEEFRAIAFAVNKIIMTALNFSIINYDFKRHIEHDDIGYFIEQYFKSFSAKDSRITVKVENTSKSYIGFPYQEVTMMLYNIVSNSKKSEATNLAVKIFNGPANKLVMRFIDNGAGIEKNIDLETLFDFGVSYKRGTGVGLAQIKDLVENTLNGTVSMTRNNGKGVTLEVKIPNENQL